MMRKGRFAGRILLAVLAWSGASAPFLYSQADDRELDAAAATLRECAQAVEKRCYYPHVAAEVISKALAELHKVGGAPGADAPPAPNLAQVSEAEAVAAARAHLAVLSSLPGQRLGPVELAETALVAYCKTIDPYTWYETAEDAARLDKASAVQSSGIGMRLEEKDGSFYCYPFPESAAALSGISPGDKVLTVDGRPLTGKSLQLIGSWIRGAPGTPVNLRLEKSGTGRAQLLAVTREAATPPPIFRVEPDSGGVVLKLRKFEPGIGARIQEELKRLPSLRLLTLDLRGNPGGSLQSAVEVAGLFLPAETKVVTIVERGMEPVPLATSNPEPLRPAQIFILQDEGTASAAEIAIAALIENLPGVAASQGGKTYGKGVVQDAVKLPGGGRLTVTVGMMFGSGGLSWNETGLQPSTTSGGKIYTDQAISITKPTVRPKPVVKLVD